MQNDENSSQFLPAATGGGSEFLGGYFSGGVSEFFGGGIFSGGGV